MTIEVQETVFDILIVTAICAVIVLLVYQKLRKFDPMSEPKGIVLLMIVAVRWVENLVREKANEDLVEKLTPYIMSIALYIFISNISGLLSLTPPTANWSVTLVLALITCVMIEVFSIKYNGWKGYLKSWKEPNAIMLLINPISKISTLASLSLRLFGNIIAGSVLMTVIYQMLSAISGIIPVIGEFNWLGVIVGAVLHMYFDLFSGAIQTYIFMMLTVSFIGKELPKEN